MSEFKVFYSWQSDLPNATNRGFIGDALEKACKQIESNPDIDEAPRLDQDTQGLPGSPSIPQAIMDKIDACQVFVADVSFCYKAEDGTMAPNPNVAYELGYAVARLSWDRILLVVNEGYGEVERLPFDLEKRRAIPYRAQEGEKDRSEAKKGLVARLSAGIEAIARRQPIVPRRSRADIAIEAVEDQIPARKARIRDFWSWVFSELRQLEPDLRSNAPEGVELTKQIEDLKLAVTNSGGLVRAFSQVCESVALGEDEDANDAIARGFGDVLVEYDHKPDWNGGLSYETWFDFWRFIGHELFTVWIACLLKEERWRLIDLALSKSYFWEQHRARTNQGTVYFDEFSEYIRLFGQESTIKRRISCHADVLSERYGPNGIGTTVSFQEFIDAELFLFLAAEFRLEAGWDGWLHWRPWSVLYMRHQPRFLTEAISRKVAIGVKQALGTDDSGAVRTLIKDRMARLREFWRGSFWRSPLTAEVIDSFDTKT